MINKLPLVLVPGLLCDAALWRGQVDDLADIAQPWIADVTRDDSMTAMARRVLAEAPPGRFALAGLSMGGYVAQAIMREAPERVERAGAARYQRDGRYGRSRRHGDAASSILPKRAISKASRRVFCRSSSTLIA